MLALHIFMNAEEMGKSFSVKAPVVEAKKDISVGLLKHGMQSGKSSVSFMFELPDGTVVFAETSLALFQAAARAFVAADEQSHQDGGHRVVQ